MECGQCWRCYGAASELSAMPSHKVVLASHIAGCLCVGVHSRVAVLAGGWQWWMACCWLHSRGKSTSMSNVTPWCRSIMLSENGDSVLPAAHSCIARRAARSGWLWVAEMIPGIGD